MKLIKFTKIDKELEMDENNHDIGEMVDKEVDVYINPSLITSVEESIPGIIKINLMNGWIEVWGELSQVVSKLEGTDSKTREIKANGNISIIEDIINYMNNVCRTSYKPESDLTIKTINARIKDGFKIEDFNLVIDAQNKLWKGTDMERYLRPVTLFGNKMEQYLGMAKKTNNPVNNTQGVVYMQDEPDYRQTGSGIPDGMKEKMSNLLNLHSPDYNKEKI